MIYNYNKAIETLAEDGSYPERLLSNTCSLTACFALDNTVNNTSDVPYFPKEKASSPRTATPVSSYAIRNSLSFVLIEILAIEARLYFAFQVDNILKHFLRTVANHDVQLSFRIPSPEVS
uniref:AlNc14C12G1485 protein n=1 Tax=Albugo laibachii Nc14 TaxID=890382 RepID=F0W3A8_9STRA|nr:AlNc14C12G1485 [Albugo laibachii Nc14]|eukprot:CCA15551.1 AlNc14C12G1485 [Albugo laibachii Nc14]